MGLHLARAAARSLLKTSTLARFQGATNPLAAAQYVQLAHRARRRSAAKQPVIWTDQTGEDQG